MHLHFWVVLIVKPLHWNLFEKLQMIFTKPIKYCKITLRAGFIWLQKHFNKMKTTRFTSNFWLLKSILFQKLSYKTSHFWHFINILLWLLYIRCFSCLKISGGRGVNRMIIIRIQQFAKGLFVTWNGSENFTKNRAYNLPLTPTTI